VRWARRISSGTVGRGEGGGGQRAWGGGDKTIPRCNGDFLRLRLLLRRSFFRERTASGI